MVNLHASVMASRIYKIIPARDTKGLGHAGEAEKPVQKPHAQRVSQTRRDSSQDLINRPPSYATWAKLDLPTSLAAALHCV